jgi:aspartate/methionine/tyrosine aminotransferase
MSAELSARMKGMAKTMIRQIKDLADPSSIDLGLGELQFPTPGAVIDHVRDKLGSWRLGYTPNEGLPELRSLIAARSGHGVPPEGVCVTLGAEEALMDVLMVLVGPGDEVLVPDPGYPAYPSLVRLAGGEPRPYPLAASAGFRLRAEDVVGRVTGKTRAVIINSPNNPTGAVYSGAELESLAAGLADLPLTVVSDEAYADIVFDGPAVSVGPLLRNCVTIGSLSKSFSMAGWRVGWCVGPADVVKAVGVFHQLAVTCPPAVCQYAAIHALSGFADDDKARYLEELKRRRDFALDCLAAHTGLSYVSPAGTFYVFVDISPARAALGTSEAVALRLLAEERVVTIPGSAFGRIGEGYLRLSFAPEPGLIEEGIKRIGRFLA